MFRSTGSYEPDPSHLFNIGPADCFDPQALTSLTKLAVTVIVRISVFRSTGSYEPDQYNEGEGVNLTSFDPQALTSLTKAPGRWNLR